MFLLKKNHSNKVRKRGKKCMWAINNKKELNSHLNQNIMLWWSKEDWNTEPLDCTDNSGTLWGWALKLVLKNDNFEAEKTIKKFITLPASAPMLCNFVSLVQASEYSLWHWISRKKDVKISSGLRNNLLVEMSLSHTYLGTPGWNPTLDTTVRVSVPQITSVTEDLNSKYR